MSEQFSLAGAVDSRVSAEKKLKADRQMLVDGIYLHSVNLADRPGRELTIENTRPETIVVKIDITGSANVQFESRLSVSEITVNPSEKKPASRLLVIDPTQGWKLKTKFAFTVREPPKEVLAAALKTDENSIQTALDNVRKYNLDADSKSVAEVISDCARLGINFVDVDFPPLMSCLGGKPEGNISFRRAKEFLPAGFKVFSGIDPSDINQGRLGDCWLLCAISSIAEFPELIERVFLTKEVNEAGIYELQLYKNGSPVVVRLDDYFPCTPGRGPIYARNNGAELWVMLLEKGCAKLCGTYDALTGGYAYEGFMDITGFPTARLDTSGPSVVPQELFKTLFHYDENKYIISGGVSGEDKWSMNGGTPQGGPGLVSGHAYSIIRVAETRDKRFRLLQIRNPWGSFEWNGDWSDKSPLWSKAVLDEIKPDLKENDGTFWMSFEDFVKYFSVVNVCFTASDKVNPWTDTRVRGQFVVRDGAVLTNSFALTVPSPQELWISIHQADDRVLYTSPYVDIAVAVYKVDRASNKRTLVKVESYLGRQAQLNLDYVEAGDYEIVPLSSGVFNREEEEKKLASGTLLDASGKLSAHGFACLNEVFRRYDHNCDGGLEANEVAQISNIWKKDNMSEEQALTVIRSFDNCGGTQMTPDGLVAWVLGSKQGEQLLRAVGYDAQLRLTGARAFAISIHSETPVHIVQGPLSADAVSRGVLDWVTKDGKMQSLAGGKIKIYTLQRGNGGVSAALSNDYPSNITATIDSSKSQNLESLTGSLVAKVPVPMGSTQMLQTLAPKLGGGFRWAYSFGVSA